MKNLTLLGILIFCTTIYAQNTELSQYQKNTMNTKRFARPVNTGVNHTLLILGSAWNVNLEIGDEIAVYDMQKNMVSSVSWRPEQQGHSGLAIFGDDETTIEKEGMKIGEIFKVVLFDVSEDALYNLNINKYERGDNKYQKDGVTVVGEISLGKIIKQEIELFQNVPNPFQSNTSISFFVPVSGNVSISLSNSLGNKIKTISNKIYEKGMHSIDLDCDGIDSGIYFYTLEMNKSELIKQFTHIK
jgi:hypothetical protein